MSHETSQRSAARPGVEPVTQVSGELPKVNTSIPLILPLALITKMYEFHVHLPSCCCFVHNSKFLDFKDELRALWTAIHPNTRDQLTLLLGQLVDAINTKSDGLRNDQLRTINWILSDRLPSSPEVVLRFMALLVDNHVPARILLEIPILDDEMSVDTASNSSGSATGGAMVFEIEHPDDVRTPGQLDDMSVDASLMSFEIEYQDNPRIAGSSDSE
jgi:hypothetical protein